MRPAHRRNHHLFPAGPQGQLSVPVKAAQPEHSAIQHQQPLSPSVFRISDDDTHRVDRRRHQPLQPSRRLRLKLDAPPPHVLYQPIPPRLPLLLRQPPEQPRRLDPGRQVFALRPRHATPPQVSGQQIGVDPREPLRRAQIGTAHGLAGKGLPRRWGRLTTHVPRPAGDPRQELLRRLDFLRRHRTHVRTCMGRVQQHLLMVQRSPQVRVMLPAQSLVRAQQIGRQSLAVLVEPTRRRLGRNLARHARPHIHMAPHQPLEPSVAMLTRQHAAQRPQQRRIDSAQTGDHRHQGVEIWIVRGIVRLRLAPLRPQRAIRTPADHRQPPHPLRRHLPRPQRHQRLDLHTSFQRIVHEAPPRRLHRPARRQPPQIPDDQQPTASRRHHPVARLELGRIVRPGITAPPCPLPPRPVRQDAQRHPMAPALPPQLRAQAVHVPAVRPQARAEVQRDDEIRMPARPRVLRQVVAQRLLSRHRPAQRRHVHPRPMRLRQPLP